MTSVGMRWSVIEPLMWAPLDDRQNRLNTRECEPGQRRHSLKGRTSVYHLLVLHSDSASIVQIFMLSGCVCVRGPNRGLRAPPSSPRRGLHMWVCPGGFSKEGLILALPPPPPPKNGTCGHVYQTQAAAPRLHLDLF